jgi:hypothetical protein
MAFGYSFLEKSGSLFLRMIVQNGNILVSWLVLIEVKTPENARYALIIFAKTWAFELPVLLYQYGIIPNWFSFWRPYFLLLFICNFSLGFKMSRKFRFLPMLIFISGRTGASKKILISIIAKSFPLYNMTVSNKKKRNVLASRKSFFFLEKMLYL